MRPGEEYGVLAVCYSEGHIENVIVCQLITAPSPNGSFVSFGELFEMDRERVLEEIEEKVLFFGVGLLTGIIVKAKIEPDEVNGVEYLKTKRDDTEVDNLDHALKYACDESPEEKAALFDELRARIARAARSTLGM